MGVVAVVCFEYLIISSTQAVLVYTDETHCLFNVDLLCGPAHVDARSWCVGSLGDGEVHSDPTTV